MFPAEIRTLILEFADDIVLSQIKKRLRLNSLFFYCQSCVRWMTMRPFFLEGSNFSLGLRYLRHVEKQMKVIWSPFPFEEFEKIKLPNFPQKRIMT